MSDQTGSAEVALDSGTGGAGDAPLIDRREELAAWLSSKENEGRVVRTRLKASERVIARVTHGIYRQPASALRELISNAWDADANLVTVLTDAPRFARIYVRDDGAGMSYAALVRVLHSIGGSAKRREEGRAFGVTAADDPDRSPGGRPLIGKIGIGLFSVSQLSNRFTIVTKVRGEDYRLIAEVRLRAYSEDGEADASVEDDSFISGDVLITRESTADIDAHGTDIILDEIKPRVRDLLRSAERWRALEEKAAALEAQDPDALPTFRVEEPRYHAGWIRGRELDQVGPLHVPPPELHTVPPKLPWGADDPPDARMRLLVEAVEQEATRVERPDLATTLDTYLETLWVLGLSVPVRYVDSHPFDLTAGDDIRLFWVSNERRGQAQELDISDGRTVRDVVREQAPGSPNLTDGVDAEAGGFVVHVDGVELRRPIRFAFSRPERGGVDKPLLFVGQYAPNLSSVDPEQRGGDLALEGYLYWAGRVIPKENNGVLIRIRGASGALFDPTFFQYQVSEQTRLRQITSELFIQRGLDAALNIDRESFNFSHPHVQLVSMWLHRAIRQLTNKHKDLSQRLRVQARAQEAAAARDELSQHAAAVWAARQGTEPIPEVAIEPDRPQAEAARRGGYVALARAEVPSLAVPAGGARDDRDAKARALIRVLAAFGVLADRPYEEQQELVDAILAVFYGRSGR